MRRLLIFLALAVLACPIPTLAGAGVELGSAQPPPAGCSLLLRVATYNLHHGHSLDERDTFAEIAGFLRDNELDLIGLEEVDRNWSSRSRFQDQAAALAEAAGLNLIFLPTLFREGSEYGLAILSRYPIVRHLSGLFCLDGEQRGYLAAEIEIAGEKIGFVVTHLGLSAAERWSQSSELTKALAELAGPLILAGDLNGGADDPAIRNIAGLFRDTLAVSGLAGQPTFIGDGTASAGIDFIFATPEFRIEGTRVPLVDFSDHRPVITYLSFFLSAPSPELAGR